MSEKTEFEHSDTKLRLNVSGHLAEILLNAPARKNALSFADWRAVPELTKQLVTHHPEVRVCVLRGAGGKAFCAGADIGEFEKVRATPDDAELYDEINVAAFNAIKQLPIPVVAAIEGPCLGGGLGLALACDIRIASNSAFFGIPAAKLGLAYPPDAVSDILTAISSSHAKLLIFSGDRFSAEHALKIGLVNELHDGAAFDARVSELCQTIARNAPLSVKAAKQTIDTLSENQTNNLDDMRKMARRCIDSHDYKEGCRAFLEKRPPTFTGK